MNVRAAPSVDAIGFGSGRSLRVTVAPTARHPGERLDRIEPRSRSNDLAFLARALAAADDLARAIDVVDGHQLRFPSQDLRAVESCEPAKPGASHALARHVGTTLADNVARLLATPALRAAGSYTSLADAQFSTDRTIANPANQRRIAEFLAGCAEKEPLARVDLGRVVGTTTERSSLVSGLPTLVPGTTATVVLIKDGSLAEGYRVLTSYPDTRPPSVDEQGTPIV